MAGLLQETDRKQLELWVNDGPKQFELLYSASRNGCNATTFHYQCDNKGPTVTVLYNKNGSVYGGYTSASWNTNGQYIADQKAFLFRLQFNGVNQSVKFSVETATQAIYGQSNYGPTFGGGHDLYTFSGSIAKTTGSYFQLNGSCSYGTSYDMQGFDINTINNGHYQVTDLEVYAVKAGTEAGEQMSLELLKDKPWRKCPEMNTQLLTQLKDEIENYQPSKELDLPQCNILMLGAVGAGKSSFFNTINSIFRGHVTSQAYSGSSEQSLTTMYRMYQIRSEVSGRPLAFRLCDTRGLEEKEGLDSEINFFLDGHVPDGYQFNPSVPFSTDVPGYIRSPTLIDRLHCVVYVVDASKMDVMPEKIVDNIKALQLKMIRKGIPTAVLLTKIDKACTHVENDVSCVYHSLKSFKFVDEIAQILGMPRSHVFPVKNYEIEIDLDTSTSCLALLALRQILRFADDYLLNCLDYMKPENLRRKVKSLNIKD